MMYGLAYDSPELTARVIHPFYLLGLIFSKVRFNVFGRHVVYSV